MRTENELQTISEALSYLQTHIGNSFDMLKKEFDELKKEINLLKYNVDKTNQENWKVNQNFKQLSDKVQKWEDENGD